MYVCTYVCTYVSMYVCTVQLKGNVVLAARHALALDVYNVEFFSFATQKSLYTYVVWDKNFNYFA